MEKSDPLDPRTELRDALAALYAEGLATYPAVDAKQYAADLFAAQWYDGERIVWPAIQRVLEAVAALREVPHPVGPPTPDEVEAACSHYEGEMNWSDDHDAQRLDAVAWLKAWCRVRDTEFHEPRARRILVECPTCKTTISAIPMEGRVPRAPTPREPRTLDGVFKRLEESMRAHGPEHLVQLYMHYTDAVALVSLYRGAPPLATIDQLATLLADYEMDEPHWDDETVRKWTPEKLREGMESPHSGDCTGQPHTCLRCSVEHWMHKAQWIAERLTGAPPEMLTGHEALASLPRAKPKVTFDEPDDPETLRAKPSERERALEAAILAIDEKATPYGSGIDEPGGPYADRYIMPAGPLHRALGIVGRSAAKLTPEQQAAVDEYVREMTETVIPEIVRVVEERAKLAVISRGVWIGTRGAPEKPQVIWEPGRPVAIRLPEVGAPERGTEQKTLCYCGYYMNEGGKNCSHGCLPMSDYMKNSKET